MDAYINMLVDMDALIVNSNHLANDRGPGRSRTRSAGEVGGNAAKAPTYCCSRCKETGGHNPRSCTRLM